MTRWTVGQAMSTWRDTYIGFNVEDMSKWWCVAKWGDDNLLYSAEQAEYMGMDLSKPYWVPWALGEGTLVGLKYIFHEMLDEDAWAWTHYKQAKQFADEVNSNRELEMTMFPDLSREVMPLNIGDYIRWEDRLIDNHKKRKLADPIFKSSQRFFASRPT